VAIALERFFVINFPLAAKRVVSEKRSKLFAPGVLIFVIFITSVSYIYQHYIDRNSFDVYAAVVLHFAPFVIVLVLNVFILIGVSK